MAVSNEKATFGVCPYGDGSHRDKGRDPQVTDRGTIGAMSPRGVNRERAAAYVGVGTTKFDEMVADGRMPKPRVVDSRKVWDVRELDEKFSALPHDGEAAKEGAWAGVS